MQERLGDVGQRRLALAAADHQLEGDAQPLVLVLSRRPAERAGRDPVQEPELRRRAGALGQRVEPHRPAGAQPHRDPAEGLGERAVLALGIEDETAAPEDRLAQQIRLDQRAFAEADLAEDDHVGVAQHPLAVKRERVVDERAARSVDADVDPLAAEPALGDERIGGLQVARGRAVARALDRAESHRARRREATAGRRIARAGRSGSR